MYMFWDLYMFKVIMIIDILRSIWINDLFVNLNNSIH